MQTCGADPRGLRVEWRDGGGRTRLVGVTELSRMMGTDPNLALSVLEGLDRWESDSSVGGMDPQRKGWATLQDRAEETRSSSTTTTTTSGGEDTPPQGPQTPPKAPKKTPRHFESSDEEPPPPPPKPSSPASPRPRPRPSPRPRAKAKPPPPQTPSPPLAR